MYSLKKAYAVGSYRMKTPSDGSAPPSLTIAISCKGVPPEGIVDADAIADGEIVAERDEDEDIDQELERDDDAVDVSAAEALADVDAVDVSATEALAVGVGLIVEDADAERVAVAL